MTERIKMTKLTLRPDAEQQSCDDFYYDLNNGYIKPDLVLGDESQVEAVVAAIDLLEQFYDLLRDNDLLEIM
jgi:hypothetical protein